jgi:hypothetical protein
MKLKLIRKFAVIALVGLFSQFSLAQDVDGALSEIADIVASINHFPSDADKAALATISGNDSLPQPLRDMAAAVSNISHSANAEGKAVMASIQGNPQAPDTAKSLAGIIAGLNHMPSAEDKATLATLFP